MSNTAICIIPNAEIIGKGTRTTKANKTYDYVQALCKGSNGDSHLHYINGDLHKLGDNFQNKKFELTVQVRSFKDSLYFNLLEAKAVVAKSV